MYKKLSCFAVALLLCGSMFPQQRDIGLLRKINLHRNAKLDAGFRFLSNTVTPLSIAAPLSLVGIGVNNHDDMLLRKGIVSSASVLLAVGISTSLKFGVARKRPFVTYDDLQPQMKVGPYSFPSGHTTTSFALATSLSLAFPKWYVIAPSFAWAAAVAYSRMHLGVHFPTDVLAGILIGAGSSLLCYEAQNWVKK